MKSLGQEMHFKGVPLAATFRGTPQSQDTTSLQNSKTAILHRNREKGVLAKGVSAGSSKKCPRILGPAVHLAPGEPQPREAYIFFKDPLPKTPFFSSWILHTLRFFLFSSVIPPKKSPSGVFPRDLGVTKFFQITKFLLLLLYSGARGPPQFLKKRFENAGANENLSGGFAAIPGIAPRVAQRIVGFVLIKSWEAIPRMEFRIPRVEFPIPRAAPRIPRNSPRAPRIAFSLRERFSWNWGGPQASDIWTLRGLFL